MVKMSKANRQVSARERSSSADRRDNSTGATMVWLNSNSASLSVSDDESTQKGHIAQQARS